MSAALQLASISHSYPGTAGRTLDDVDLDVAAGEMVAVLGPSGSGKTTLLRIAAGLQAPTAGDVSIDGRSVRDVPPEQRDLTVMFQRPHLFPHLDVRDNVAFADRLRGLSRARSREAAQRYLDLVHLGDLARRRPRQLSGGQEQRVALARALAANRRVMLLDEPFSSLDAGLRRSMHVLLGEVRAALAPTVVMVTHDLEEAGLAERVAVLVDGRVEQFAAAAALYSEPRTVTVARLVGGFNEVPGSVIGAQHHSALGALPVRAGAHAPRDATALVRKEQLRLLPAGAPSSVPGQVVAVRQSGPRQDAVVELDAPAPGPRPRVEVELDLGTSVHLGELVAVRLRAGDGVWVVPTSCDPAAAAPVGPPRPTTHPPGTDRREGIRRGD